MISNALTQLQQDRLLRELMLHPGASTKELANLISETHQRVYEQLCRFAHRGLAYSRLERRNGHSGSCWYPTGCETEPDASESKGVTADDLAWMAHYRQRHEQRHEPRHE